MSLKKFFAPNKKCEKDTVDYVLPQGYNLEQLLSRDSLNLLSLNDEPPSVRSIAMVGALHDGQGGLWEDDGLFLKGIISCLVETGETFNDMTRVIPMNLRYGEDVFQVVPQVDMFALHASTPSFSELHM